MLLFSLGDILIVEVIIVIKVIIVILLIIIVIILHGILFLILKVILIIVVLIILIILIEVLILIHNGTSFSYIIIMTAFIYTDKIYKLNGVKIKVKNKIILASKSPRRREILDIAKIPYKVYASEINEAINKNLTARQASIELAKLKATDVKSKFPIKSTVVGCDTLVCFKNKIFGKPQSTDDAINILKTLSGKIHQVYTGVCILKNDLPAITFSEQTDVEFWNIDEDEIIKYVKTGEPLDKAGAYGIQDKGCLFVKAIYGDFYNVMGLPVAKLSRILSQLDKNF